MGPVSTRLRDAAKISRLGRGPFDGTKLAATHLAFPLARRLRIPIHVSAQLAIGATMRFSDDSELLVLKELLAESEYDLSGLTEPQTILDLGANIGIAAMLFRDRFPAARIVCVEASPRTYQRLLANVGADPKIETVNAAVTGASGSVSFTDGAESWDNHVAADGAVTVDAVTLDDLIERYAISDGDLIKLDIEGSEFDALPVSRLLNRAGTLLGEIHPGVGDPTALFAELEHRGWVMDRPLHRSSFRFVRAPGGSD